MAATRRFKDLWATEVLKLSRRRHFWAILATFAAGGVAQTVVRLKGAAASQGVEQALQVQWQTVVTGFYVLSVLLIPLVMVQRTASEFEQRTARQSVASGVSRTELLLSMLIGGAILVSLFWLTALLASVGVVGVMMESGPGFPAVGFGGSMLMGRLLVAQCGLAGLGLFAGMLFRRTGTAIVWLAMYAVAVERALGAGLEGVGGGRGSALLPLATFRSLVLDAGSGTGLTADDASIPISLTLLAALVYILAFLGASLLLLKKRDL